MADGHGAGRARLAATLILGASLMAVPAAADWPATSFLPVPVGDESPGDMMEAGFEQFAEDADTTEEAGGIMGLSLEGLDITAMRRGANAALTDIMRLVAIDAARMEKAGFPPPKIEPLLRVEETGQAFYSIFWMPKFNDEGTFKHYCFTNATTFAGMTLDFTRKYRWHIYANGKAGGQDEAFPYSRLAAAYKAGGKRKSQMFDYMSSQLTHEVMHGVQANGFDSEGCGQAPEWLHEGLANGTAFYLLAKRSPGVFDRETWTRDERRYDIPLDGRGASKTSQEALAYGAGSFYRYLMEASEGGGADGLAIVKDLLTMPPAAVKSREGIYVEIDGYIAKHSGGRSLYHVWPEFLTEYASYGEGRYKTAGGGGKLDRERWIEDAFDGCVEFKIRPNEMRMHEVTVRPIAGECIKVTWSGFTEPVALQLYAIDAGDDFGALHLGEAMRADSSGRHFCYRVTRQLDRRIAERMRKKCILKRGARALSGGGEAREELAWTSDFNLTGSGDAHFVLSNVAKTPAETRPVTFQLLVGAVAAKAASGRHVAPRKPAASPEPVQHGLTDVDSRVHAMSGGGDRILFDGRSIFGPGEGLGYLEGMPGATGGGEGVMALVRGGDYWLSVVRRSTAVEGFKRGGQILKDPERMLAGFAGGGFPMGGMPMQGPIMSAVVEGMTFDQDCGYTVPGEFELLEDSPERIRFRVTGDLFDMMRAAGLGGDASTCEIMRAAWVEFASFEVSLPNGLLHAADSRIERRSPPGQEVYDDTDFLNGPNFGGIASSRSLIAEGEGPGEAPPDAGRPDGSGAASGGGRLMSGPAGCDCRCPDIADPPSAACRAQCVPRLAACTPDARTAVDEAETEAPEPREPTLEAQRKWFARLVSGQGLAPETEAMLVEDFATMSPETRRYLIRKYRRGVP